MAKSNVGQICYRIHTVDYSTTPPTAVIKTIGLDSATAYDSMFGYNGYTLIPEGQLFTKLGVQATPGTRMIVNGQKEIMVGRTGIFEIDDVTITELKFIPVKQYVYDAEQSQKLIDQGWAIMMAAHYGVDDERVDQTKLPQEGDDNWDEWAEYTDYEGFDDLVADLDPTAADYQEQYVAYAETYEEIFTMGYDIYQSGINGVYVPKTNEDGSEVNADLTDVIIDFVWQINEEGETA